MEYSISFQKAEKYEKKIRKFFLDHADVVRLTEAHWNELRFFYIKRRGGESDPKFKETMKTLHPFFQKTMKNQKKYNDVLQQGNTQFVHHFFRLTPKLKKCFEKEGLLFDLIVSRNFYGLEDPTFYKKGVMRGSVISHEPIIIVYLTTKERNSIWKKGVKFD